MVPIACKAAADAGIRSACVTNFRYIIQKDIHLKENIRIVYLVLFHVLHSLIIEH